MIAFQRRYSESSVPYYLKENVNTFVKISLQNDFFLYYHCKLRRVFERAMFTDTPKLF
jgi:hypothetical protein